MSTPSLPQRPVSNSNSTGSNSGPRWPKAEPGSAFSGLTRGRGRGGGGGRGRGRGGRGGGPSRDSKPSGDALEKPSDTRTRPSPSPTVSEKQPSPVIPPPPAAEKAPITSPTTGAPPRPKGPSRRASRSIPSVSVTSSPTIPDVNPSPNTSTRSQNKKRRSHHGKSNNPPKAPTPPDEQLLHPQKARSGPAPPKDTPPHLATFDMRTNIDALVERVRAVAMAENRPSTPGSHIDWAGDDDDSLPDLDDWGITTNGSGVNRDPMDSAISPIMVDGLKALPDPLADVPGSILSPKPVGVASSSSASLSPFPPPSPSNAAHAVPRNKSPLSMDNGTLPAPSAPTESNPSAQSSTKGPRHPSLPPKPTGFKDPHRGGRGSRQPRNNQNKNQVAQVETKPVDISTEDPSSSTKATNAPVPISTAPERSDATNEGPAQSAHAPVNSNAEPPETGVAASIHAPKEDQGVAASMHAPRAEEIASAPRTHEESLAMSLHAPKDNDGLGASIHAPQGPSDSMSAPGHISSYDLPESRGYPTHTRAHTVGRTPHHPRSGDHAPRNGRSGFTSPRGGVPYNQHNRTHSSPNFGGIPHRAPHDTRPRITGEAISKLARTIGTSGLSSPRVSTITTND
ncbi:hypothetical protein BDN72DRAFT_954624 [Pluteus cervinus]|uniref:Uncharacterized protein n=1 Tax=Pluteus cervinus TaxID=181527 RepID=A0ACD3BDF2_9AGAR|nr:hypothetical protein BDN72DRAFT_954624 [Pluteus cervinus]